MDNVKFNPAALASIKNNTQQKIEEENKQPVEQKKNGKKLLALGAAALATAAIAGIAIYKHKTKITEIADNLVTDGVKKLSIDDFKQNGKFDKGFATYENKPFSGVIDVARDDCTYKLEYKDGNLLNSIKYKITDDSLTPDGLMPLSKKEYIRSPHVYTAKLAPKNALMVNEYVYDYHFGGEGYVPYNILSTVIENKGNITRVTEDFSLIEGNPFYQKVTDVIKNEDGTVSVDKILDPRHSYRTYYKHSKYNTIGEGKEAKKILIEKSSKLDEKEKSYALNRTTDKNGITTKNGKFHSKRTIKYDEKGNKIITVDYKPHYTDYGPEPLSYDRKIITISPDGKKTSKNVTDGKDRFLDL